LFDLDDALANVVARASEPALGAIKLAWWRDRLAELDAGIVPAEPRLRAAADALLPSDVRGEELAALTDGWAALLEEAPDIERIGEGGAKLFAIAAHLFGADDPLIGAAGRLYRQEQVERRRLLAVHWPMDELNPLVGHRFAKPLRPLSGLAALARRDLLRGNDEPEATPGRSWALIRHRLTGRI
jgi:phytoene synthase